MSNLYPSRRSGLTYAYRFGRWRCCAPDDPRAERRGKVLTVLLLAALSGVWLYLLS